jgi:hypothetical protein
LPNLDRNATKSDPMLVLYRVDHGTENVKIGQTEMIIDDLNPKWI